MIETLQAFALGAVIFAIVPPNQCAKRDGPTTLFTDRA